MEISRGPEMAMLRFVVLPSIGKVKKLLEEGNKEDAYMTVARDILGLLMPYMESENSKYENTPEGLKDAPQKKRMKENAEMFGKAIDNLFDAKINNLRPDKEWDLDFVERMVNEVLNS